MAAKQAQPELERVYTVPLRREFLKVPRWRRTKKAVAALRQFLGRHMKSENVKLSPTLNEHMWKHGIKNPPHHVKVNVSKNKEGVVRASLFGETTQTKAAPAPKKEEKSSKEVEEAKEKKKEARKKSVPNSA